MLVSFLLMSATLSSLKPRRVAIVGGGPASFVACKKLIDSGITPKLFCDTIGGLWNKESKPLWSSMRTNLSKYTCSFSDHPWPKKTPIFPSQCDMFRYLISYSETFISPTQIIINCTVTHVMKGPDGKFLLTWSNKLNIPFTEEFDDIVIATGFFSNPILNRECFKNFKGKVIHSSEYKNAEEFKDSNVVVVGSSFSSAEISADVARVAKKVHNVIPRASWVIPRYLPFEIDKPNTSFLPIDLLFYRLDNKKDLTSRTEALFKNDEDRLKSNEYMQSLVGTTKRDVMNKVTHNCICIVFNCVSLMRMYFLILLDPS